MVKTIKHYGIYAAIVGGLLFMAGHFIDWGISFSTLEFLGYTSIFAALTFIFFGIRHFRDNLNNGVVSFKQALIIGLAISSIAGLAIGVLDIIYVTIINPDFITEYSQYVLEGMEATLSTDEFEVKKIELNEQMKLFESPIFAGLLMFTIVFAIGIIVSLLSSLMLKRKEQ